MFLSVGLGGGPDDAWNWQTLTWSPFNAADETGLIVRGSLKGEAKTYVTDIPARTDARIWVAGIGLDGELGWQVAGDWGQAAVLAGVAWRDYALSPLDPNSPLGPNQLHVRATAQGHLIGAQDWGAFWYGDYISGVDEWFAEIKPYYRLGNGLMVGPEFSMSGGGDYLHARAGASVMGWEFTLPWAGTFWAGGSAGALWDTDGSRVEPYGALHLTRAITSGGF
jgi:hypothetical protein